MEVKRDWQGFGIGVTGVLFMALVGWWFAAKLGVGSWGFIISMIPIGGILIVCIFGALDSLVPTMRDSKGKRVE